MSLENWPTVNTVKMLYSPAREISKYDGPWFDATVVHGSWVFLSCTCKWVIPASSCFMWRHVVLRDDALRGFSLLHRFVLIRGYILKLTGFTSSLYERQPDPSYTLSLCVSSSSLLCSVHQFHLIASPRVPHTRTPHSLPFTLYNSHLIRCTTFLVTVTSLSVFPLPAWNALATVVRPVGFSFNGQSPFFFVIRCMPLANFCSPCSALLFAFTIFVTRSPLWRTFSHSPF